MVVDQALARWFPIIEREHPGDVGRAIVYSLSGPGKRLRPALVMAGYRAFGGTGDASDLAAAVEVVHTYSLVHDDLPCMDNDDLRRGRPTVHRAFDVATATEAGFRMVPLAAEMLRSGTDRLALDEIRRRAVARELFRGAGAGGMIGGQVLDIEEEGREPTLERLTAIHRAKTGALITAAVMMGAIAAGADGHDVEELRSFGEDLGLAFQIVDDVLDATASSDELGKTAGKDARQRKVTFVSLLSPEEALAGARGRVGSAVDRLGAVGVDCTLLAGIAEVIVNRRS